MKIEVDIDEDKFPEIAQYTTDEVKHICKQSFIDWYRKRHQPNLDNKICEVLQSTLVPVIQDLHETSKELFGISKVSQKKGEIMENNVFEMFRNSLQDYAITPTNHLPHNADAEVVTPNNVKLLLEIKNYTNAVDQKEINKLKYDMKETGIRHALFISIKSAVSGKKMIDYEVCEEGLIVFLSYVGDVTKVHCGLLLVDMMSQNLMVQHKDDDVELTLREGLEEMTQVIDMYMVTKDKFMDMEKHIKSHMDSFYLFIRDNELKLKEKINEIFGTITKQVQEVQKTELPKDKYLIVMQRTIDILENNGIEIVQREDNLWDLKRDDLVLGELKKRKVGVDVILKRPNIEMRMANDDVHFKMLEDITKS
jgi:hypothetical protein